MADIKQKVHAEMENIESILAELRKVKDKPDKELVVLVGIGAYLQNIYNGIENIFKRIIPVLGQELPVGDMWHSHLLDLMAQPLPNHPPVISATLQDRLRLYMNFRHVFRHAYSFDLQWQKMSELVHQCDEILSLVETDLANFLRSQY